MAKNLFAGAKTVENQEVEKKGKKEAPKVRIGDMDTLSAVNALIDTLGAYKKTVLDTSIKDEMQKYFVGTTIKEGQRPVNFKGIGDFSEASCEMKKRSSSSSLSSTEEAILVKYGISFEEVVVSPAIEERFFFNPDILKNAKLMKTISSKLQEIPELNNIDVIMRQPAKEAETAKIVTDQSFVDAAKITDPSVLTQVYSIISSLAIKTKMTVSDMSTVLKLIQEAGINLSADEPKRKAKK